MKLMIDIPDNEEAIKKIVELCEYKAYNYTVLTDEVIKKIDNKALYKAIEALKNEPFLIDALHKAHAEIKEMDKRIAELKEERPKGEWIRQPSSKTIFFCSECGREINTSPFTRTDNFPFCHCGADMRGNRK